MNKFIKHSKLEDDSKIYKYVSLSSFMNIMEFGKITFTNIKSGWDDSWEAPLSRLDKIDDNGNKNEVKYSISDDIFGQCWTTNNYSDAMWRIYSQDKQGIMITTTIDQVKNLDEIEKGFICDVIYYDEKDLGIVANDTKKIKNIPDFIIDASLKRAAFKHEEEIRIMFVNGQGRKEKIDDKKQYIEIDIDISKFIKGITIDPRADSYYLNIIKSYCSRYNLNCPVMKSELYNSDVKTKTRLVTRYRTIK